MKICKYELDKEDISVGVMILAGLVAMFFLGYYLAYDQAVDYAQQTLDEALEEINIRANNNIEFDLDNFVLDTDIKFGDDKDGGG